MNPFTPATTSIYTIGFRTSTAGALAGGTGTITIDDGAGQLPSSAADYSIGATGHSGAPSNVTTSANSVTLTVPVVSGLNIGNSTIVSVTVNPITTPAMGNYTMSVSTSADTTAVTDTYSIDTATQVVPTAGNNQSAQPNAAFPAHLGARIRTPAMATSTSPAFR